MSTTRVPYEAAAGLPPQLRDLFAAYGPFVCRSLRYLGVHEPDLDDAVQEVFLVVHQRSSDYQEKGRARSWLYSICTRVAHAQRRKQGRRREAPVLPEISAAPTQLEHVQNREALALGWQLLQALTAEQREVFVLYEVEDMPMSEIAQALSCPLQTAYSRLHKARERILAEVQRMSAEAKP